MVLSALSFAIVVLGAFLGMRMLRHADPRWGRLEVYAVLGVGVFVMARLANARLLRCPRCDAPLYEQMSQILLKEVRSCPQCGLSFADRYP